MNVIIDRAKSLRWSCSHCKKPEKVVRHKVVEEFEEIYRVDLVSWSIDSVKKHGTIFNHNGIETFHCRGCGKELFKGSELEFYKYLEKTLNIKISSSRG